MPAPSKYRNIHRLNINIERDMFNDFKDLCWDERKSISDKINELILETVEKKAFGDQTPIKISYNRPQQKASPMSQSDIRLWLPRNEALLMAKRYPLDAIQWQHLSQTFSIIARKVQTGYLWRVGWRKKTTPSATGNNWHILLWALRQRDHVQKILRARLTHNKTAL